ncbi:hypothetical protein GCM10008941_13480 [Rhizomicrobium palustre]
MADQLAPLINLINEDVAAGVCARLGRDFGLHTRDHRLATGDMGQDFRLQGRDFLGGVAIALWRPRVAAGLRRGILARKIIVMGRRREGGYPRTQFANGERARTLSRQRL